MITSHGDPALGGVYKLVAVDDETGSSQPAIKISENIEKIAVPGDKRVVRAYDRRGLATADIIATADEDPLATDPIELYHPHREAHRSLQRSDISDSEELLEPVFVAGRRRDGEPDLAVLRERRTHDLERLDPGVRRLVNPHIYHVSLTKRMKNLQLELIAELEA